MEFTFIRRKKQVILQRKGFLDLNEIKRLIKFNNIKKKVAVEYTFFRENQFHLYGVFFFKEGKTQAAIFPFDIKTTCCDSYQKNSLGLRRERSLDYLVSNELHQDQVQNAG